MTSFKVLEKLKHFDIYISIIKNIDRRGQDLNLHVQRTPALKAGAIPSYATTAARIASFTNLQTQFTNTLQPFYDYLADIYKYIANNPATIYYYLANTLHYLQSYASICNPD